MLLKENKRVSFFVVIFAWLFFITAFSTNVHAIEQVTEQQKLNSVRELIDTYYYQAVPDEVLQKNSIDQILGNLDKHSQYMSSVDYQRFLDSISQQVTGIGVQVEKVEKGLLVINVFADGGATEVGIKVGDIIVQADGVRLDELALEVAITKVTGEIGTEVELKFYRPSENGYNDVTVVRKLVKAPLVKYEKLGGNVGFIRLNSFGDGATSEIKAVIEKINSSDRFIFDLRNNGGGYFNIAREVVGFFPNVENAISLDEKDNKKLIFPAIKQKITFQKPFAVLINQNSASASEIVAAAIADYDAADLYGQTSFGKGTMQSLFSVMPELGDQSDVLKLTTGEFFSPLGNKINQVGVTPDIVTEVGFELVKAHQDALAAIFAEYDNLDGVVASADRGEMMVRFADSSLMDELKVELVELGAADVPLTTEKITKNELKITFSSLLKAESEYIVLLHLNATTGESAGYQLPLTVKSGAAVPLISIETKDAPIFKDVTLNQTVGYAEILELADREIILGYPDDTFRPNEKISRMHVAALLQRELGLEIPSDIDKVLADFDDVDVNHQLVNEIAAVLANGVFKGYQGKFSPNQKITRAEIATVFVRAYGIESNDDVQISLVDLDQISVAEHQKNVIILAQNKVVSGRPDGEGSYYYEGTSPLTRAEFAIMLVNLRDWKQ